MTRYEQLEYKCAVLQEFIPDPYKKTVKELNDEMLAEIKSSYIAGSNDCHDAMKLIQTTRK